VSGFYCFKSLKTGEPNCLGDGKGRTRKEGGPNFSQRLKSDLKTFFEPYNKKLYQFVGEDFKWN